MGGCCTATNQKPKKGNKSKSADAPIKKGKMEEIDDDATL